ncbi:hypothetical protein JHK82_024133 [Glycine max]|nr:hypothetical protein JHK82_024133 [Glycine max]
MHTHTHSSMWDSLIQGLHDPEKALSVLQRCVKDRGVVPSSSTFSLVVHKLSSKGLMGRAIEALELMAGDGVRYSFDDFDCSSVISGFCRIGKPELALGFFKNVTECGRLRPNVVTCTALVAALCKMGRVGEVCGLVQWMEKEGLGLDVILYSAWACGYVEERVLGEVFGRMREMVGKGGHDFVSYTVLVGGFSKLGDVEKSFTFLAKMIKEGHRPNKVTYSAIMSAYCKKRKLEEAFDVFESMEGLGIVRDEYVFVILIDGFGRRGDFDKADVRGGQVIEKCRCGCDYVQHVAAWIYRREEHSGDFANKEATGRIWNFYGCCDVLIKALFMMGAFEDVYALYKGMPEMDLVPNSVTYCTMIDGYCKVGRIDEALEVFDEFRKTSILSLACYNTIINGLCKNGMTEMAIEALLELNHEGLELDPDYGLEPMVHTIIACYLCLKDVNSALIFLGKTVNNSSTVTFLASTLKIFIKESRALDAYRLVTETQDHLPVMEGFLLDAEHVYRKMVLKGFQPKAQVYNSLLDGISKFGQLEKAFELLNDMETKYIEPDSLTISAVINCYCQKGNMHGALEFYYKFKRKDMSPDFFGFLYLIRGLCTKGRMEEARSVLREMLQSKNVVELINTVNKEVDTESISDFLATLCEEGRVQEAVTVLNQIACLLFPVQRLSTYYQGFHKQQKIYEWKDFGSISSSILPSSCQSSLNLGSCDDKDVRNLITSNGGYMTRSQLHGFDFYYSRMAPLCAKGELQKANQSAKEFLSDLTESMN